MNENLIAPEQRTPEWYQARAGKFTGSRFVDVLATKTNKDGDTVRLKAYIDLIEQVMVERLTGEYEDTGLDSHSLRWGREVELFARKAYEFETGETVTTAPFIQHKILPFVGVSPDGLVGVDGGTEFKCPIRLRVHLDRFYNGMDEVEFMPQVQGCIWVCERDWWDWVSYHPRMPEHLRFYRQRIWRDDVYIKRLERAVLLAEAEVRQRLEEYSPERIYEILEKRIRKPT